jgi:Baseplate J-like protein
MSQERRARVANSTRNGIDFVNVDASQVKITVNFLNKVNLSNTGLTSATITGGDVVPTVAVKQISYVAPTDSTSPSMTIIVNAPGDFSEYTLTLNSPELDPYFSSIRFSFKANCESDFDCLTPYDLPAQPTTDLPSIDYLAKDYLSFRQALLDFSAERYPNWRERSPADFGVMLLEMLCAVMDELSYLQDRVHNESSLELATERRSVTRLARLVDYEPQPATAARTWLYFKVKANTQVSRGFPVVSRTPDGGSITFEVGDGMTNMDSKSQPSIPLFENKNQLEPHWWVATENCLRAGSREAWIKGHTHGFVAGERLLIETRLDVGPPIREWVVLAAAQVGDEIEDPFPEVNGSVPTVTRLRFDDPTQFDHMLPSTTIYGNIVPASQGQTIRGEVFVIPGGNDAASQAVRQAIWRSGPLNDDGRVNDQFLYTLDTEGRLAWLAPEGGGPAVPEIALIEQDGHQQAPWLWRKWLLSAAPFDKAFTIDPVRYRRITTAPGIPPACEYDGEGETIRFGFRGLCEVPNEGSQFELIYRIAEGAIGNVPSDTITRFDNSMLPDVESVTNPFPAVGGADAESLRHIRDHAPQKFRVEQLRAVRPDDYRRTAEELPWVQRAGANFRWTGSWLTGFVAVDPRDGREPSVQNSIGLSQLLDRRRLAGYEVFVAPPRYVALDIHLEVCAQPDVYAGHVAEAIRRIVASTSGAFFDPNNFTFGGSLRRSALEHAIHQLPGVAGVLCIRVRRRGQTTYAEMPETISVGTSEIIQVASDPNRPDRGRVEISVRGGR